MRKYRTKLWTNYQEVCAYAKSRAVALEIDMLIRPVPGGWLVPYYFETSNGYRLTSQDRDRNLGDDFDPNDSVGSDDDEDVGDGSSGLSSTCGETVMEGYLLFHGD